jgi:LuxR family maltose regulon positive regulatory protein
LETIDALLEIARSTHNTRYEIEIRAVRALALAALGKARESQAELRQAVDLAKPGGFVRVFLDLGPEMQEVLGGLAQKGRPARALQAILSAFSDQGINGVAGDGRSGSNLRSTSGHPALIEPLSPRELQVLVYMREPFGLREIARRLDIRYATVKRHSINIYAKLGVNSRWEAVARAQELDILPPS